VTEIRTCDQCGKHLITHRADARFCDERCRARWNYKHRESATATDIRITPAEGGVGSRGGNVRSVSEARELQSASKELDRWRLIMEQQVFRTLLSTGYFHVDDLDCLDLPPAAFEVRGTLVNRVRAKGWMQRSGAERKVAHKAANARKAPIYRITTKGREELPTLVGNNSGEGGSSSVAAAVVSDEIPVADTLPGALPGGSAHTSAPGSSDQTLVGVDGEQDSRSVVRKAGSGASVHPDESEALPLFEDSAPSAYDPYSEAA
jgi:hypothetical protein